MGEIVEGRYEEDEDVEIILDRMVENASAYFGESLKEDELNTVRMFYYPIALEQLQLQQDIGLVLDSVQIDHAKGQALDYLCALINIIRNEPEPSTGEVEFSRDSAASQDYTIPSGTVVQTNDRSPIKFETTESVTLSSGDTSVTALIEAVEGGLSGNVASDRIVKFESKPSGVESVTNPEPTSGGTQREEDDELRERAKEQVADGSGASAPALLTSIDQISESVRSVSIEINDTSVDNSGSGGLPDHSFELVVECPSELYQDVADKLMEKKAAGDNAHAGVYGTEINRDVLLPNGQYHDVSFSTPEEVEIYIDVELEVEDTYPGDDELRDNIVEYVGGTTVAGEPEPGDLRVGEDVIYGEIEFAIRRTKGVYDVTSLQIGTSASPTSTSNISMEDTQIGVHTGNDATYFSIGKTDV